MDSLSENQKVELTPVDFDPFADGDVLLTAPATEAQKEIWASVQMGDDANCAYNESITLSLRGRLNFEALQTAWQQLVERQRISTYYPLTPMVITFVLVLPPSFLNLAHRSIQAEWGRTRKQK